MKTHQTEEQRRRYQTNSNRKRYKAWYEAYHKLSRKERCSY